MNELLHHIAFMAQILLLSVFWIRRLKRKPNFLLRALLCVLMIGGSLIVIAFIRLFLQGDNWWIFSYPYLVMLVLYGVSLGICFDASLDVILLTHLLPSTAQLCASAIGDMLNYATGGTLPFVCYDLISIVVICVVCFWLGGVYDKYAFYDRDIYRIINCACYFVVTCVFLLNAFSPDINDRFVRYVLVAGYRFLMSAFVFFLIFSLLNAGSIRYQKDMTDILLRNQEQQFAVAQNLTELVNIKYHDMKHMGSADANRALLESDARKLDYYECIIKCGNAALDTALTEKSIVCKQNRIDFTMMVHGELLAFMLPVDIYALFGNMLENAINCLVELPEEDRHLRLYVTAVGSMVSVVCENVCRDDLQFANGLPQTQHEDMQNHGFGTRSIARICEKYDAKFRMTNDDGMFVVKILLPAEK
jgi:hypothetical protein